MACEYGNVPILGALSHRLLELTKHVHVRKSVIDTMSSYERERYLLNLEPKIWMRTPNVGKGTRLLVERLQNISVSQQLSIEERMKNLPLGDFSLPELDFDPIHVANMLRCRPSTKIIREVNVLGRSRVVAVMRQKLLQDCKWSSKMKRMIVELEMLERGRL